jgi:hypothetical protein
MTLTDAAKVDGTRDFLRDNFAEAKEIECFGGSVKYSIGAQSNKSLADIFESGTRPVIEANHSLF